MRQENYEYALKVSELEVIGNICCITNWSINNKLKKSKKNPIFLHTNFYTFLDIFCQGSAKWSFENQFFSSETKFLAWIHYEKGYSLEN